MKYEVRSCMGQLRLSFLFLMSIENDFVETLTVACREKGERGDVLRHPRQKVIKRMKLQKVKGCNWTNSYCKAANTWSMCLIFRNLFFFCPN